MIRCTKKLTLLAALLLLFPAITLAAHRSYQAPKEGDMAVSGNIGFANAFDDDFDDIAPILTATFEYYTTPRVSWRGLLGFTEFEADAGPFDVEVEFMFVNGNVVYNWEGDWIHPYVTGGVGVYDKDASAALPPGSDDTELGINFGGGMDMFMAARWAIKLEGIFHGVSGEEPDSFFAGTVGAKFWF